MCLVLLSLQCGKKPSSGVWKKNKKKTGKTFSFAAEVWTVRVLTLTLQLHTGVQPVCWDQVASHCHSWLTTSCWNGHLERETEEGRLEGEAIVKYRPEEARGKMDRGYSTEKRTVTGGEEEEDGVGRGRCQDENLTNSASGAAEVKGTQPKKVKDEIKASALRCPEAQLKIYPSRARPPLTRGRQEAKYCTPLGDLSFSTDQ